MVDPLRTIGNHGVIGDLQTVALVALDATIDYLCWPSLDSPTIFADLLDPGTGGAFTLRPEIEGVRHVQVYVPDTNVLITRWMSEHASAEVIDFMPHPDARLDHPTGARARALIRHVSVTRGTIDFTTSCMPRFDYAREVPEVIEAPSCVCFAGTQLTLQL